MPQWARKDYSPDPGDGYGDGYGYGYGDGGGYGDGHSYGHSYGDGYGYGYGDGDGYGYGYGYMVEHGDDTVTIGCAQLLITEWLGAKGKRIADDNNVPDIVRVHFRVLLESWAERPCRAWGG